MNEPKRIQKVYVFVRDISSKYEWESITEAGFNQEGKIIALHLPPHYMIVSDPIFIDVAHIEPTVEVMLDALDKKEKQIKDEAMERLEYALSDIKDRRAQLLQIGFDGEVA